MTTESAQLWALVITSAAAAITGPGFLLYRERQARRDKLEDRRLDAEDRQRIADDLVRETERVAQTLHATTVAEAVRVAQEIKRTAATQVEHVARAIADVTAEQTEKLVGVVTEGVEHSKAALEEANGLNRKLVVLEEGLLAATRTRKDCP